jgi:hypothetical protein
MVLRSGREQAGSIEGFMTRTLPVGVGLAGRRKDGREFAVA